MVRGKLALDWSYGLSNFQIFQELIYTIFKDDRHKENGSNDLWVRNCKMNAFFLQRKKKLGKSELWKPVICLAEQYPLFATLREKWMKSETKDKTKKNLKRVHAKPWRQRKWGKMNKKVWHWLLSNQVIIVVICLDNTYTAFSNCRTISYITANSCTCPKKSWKLPTSWTSWGFLGDE